VQVRFSFKVQDEGHWHDALLFGIGGVATEKYVVDILKKFGMVDCSPMSTSMITNLKKLNASESELVDPTLYMQLIGSLMYLVNTRPDIFFSICYPPSCTRMDLQLSRQI
jgi:hypothetical protein